MIKFIILISLTPPSANTKRWEENWRKALLVTVCCYLAFSSTQTHGKDTNSDSASVVLSAFCHQSAVVQRLTEQKQSLCLIYTSRAGGCLILFCLMSRISGQWANSRPSLSLRFLWSPAGSCCLSSKCGPGSIFSTSSMLRHPGLAKTCVSRMLSGA